MSYKLIRSHFASAGLHIPRNLVRDQVLHHTGVNSVRVVATTLNVNVCRGLYLSPRNTEHPLSKQFGGHLIVLARGMNRCWQRFVFVKELMHMLDGQESATDSGQEFEKMLTELSAPSMEKKSPQFISEIRAFWMALGVLCPDKIRHEYVAKRGLNKISDLQIASEIKIPEAYVPRLFTPSYAKLISTIQ